MECWGGWRCCGCGRGLGIVAAGGGVQELSGELVAFDGAGGGQVDGEGDAEDEGGDGEERRGGEKVGYGPRPAAPGGDVKRGDGGEDREREEHREGDEKGVFECLGG